LRNTEVRLGSPERPSTAHSDLLFFALLIALKSSDGVSVAAGGDGGVLPKGVAPPHVTLNQIVASVMPFMGIQVIALILLYLFPGIGLLLPHLL